MSDSDSLSKETTFTPGTWHASRNFRVVGDSPGIDIGSSNGTNVATVHFSHYEQSLPEVSANADLIASAKELYEALKGLLGGVLLTQKAEHYPSDDPINKAIAALARARGEDRSHEGK